MSKITNDETSGQIQENLKKLVETVDKTVNQSLYCRTVCNRLRGKNNRSPKEQREWDECGCKE